MESKFTPEQMRNVTLGNDTKEYLIAYKTAEQASSVVYEQVEQMWGYRPGTRND